MVPKSLLVMSRDVSEQGAAARRLEFG